MRVIPLCDFKSAGSFYYNLTSFEIECGIAYFAPLRSPACRIHSITVEKIFISLCKLRLFSNDAAPFPEATCGQSKCRTITDDPLINDLFNDATSMEW
jgi:hypothetical protein